MPYIPFRLSIAVVAMLPVAVAGAADIARGKVLHDDHCVACHKSMFGGDATRIYTRPDRRVQTRDGLTRQVERCKNSLGLQWFDEEVADVAEYLNATYYKLK